MPPHQAKTNPMRADPLIAALGLSLGLHLALMMVPLAQPATPIQTVITPPLEVILLNARRSGQAPEPKPQALAQTHWAGGGDVERGRSRSPRAQSNLPSSPSRGDAISEQLSQLEQQQQALLHQIRQKSARSSEPVQRALAEIEQRIQDENARPRKRYLGPSTREVAYAEYYDRLRRSIEAQGTRHFPTHRGQRLYGVLTMILTVDTAGRMVATELVAGSGNPELDRRARSIVNSAAPFGPFTSAMKQQADQLAWVIRFSFNTDGGLRTEWREPDRSTPDRKTK